MEGIIIGGDLFSDQSYSENRELCDIITRLLDKDKKALIELSGFWCGGGAGCYDLGFVLTQIIRRIGEKEFIVLTEGLTKHAKAEIEGLIAVGLEYGDNDCDGKMDNWRIEEVFPELEGVLNEG